MLRGLDERTRQQWRSNQLLQAQSCYLSNLLRKDQCQSRHFAIQNQQILLFVAEVRSSHLKLQAHWRGYNKVVRYPWLIWVLKRSDSHDCRILRKDRSNLIVNWLLREVCEHSWEGHHHRWKIIHPISVKVKPVIRKNKQKGGERAVLEKNSEIFQDTRRLRQIRRVHEEDRACEMISKLDIVLL